METINQIQLKLEDLESNVKFYKKEINFLLKILTKEYTISIANIETIKLLDSYWIELEKYQQRFKGLESKIKIQKQELLFLCKLEIESSMTKSWEEDKIVIEYIHIVNSLKKIKERVYNYMENKIKRTNTLVFAF